MSILTYTKWKLVKLIYYTMLNNCPRWQIAELNIRPQRHTPHCIYYMSSFSFSNSVAQRYTDNWPLRNEKIVSVLKHLYLLICDKWTSYLNRLTVYMKHDTGFKSKTYIYIVYSFTGSRKILVFYFEPEMIIIFDQILHGDS